MATKAGPLVVAVADLRKRPGNRRQVIADVPVGPVNVMDSSVPEGSIAHVDLMIESLTDGVTVTGTIDSPWRATCRRCLEPVHSHTVSDVRELFADRPLDEETFPIEGDVIDLAPLVIEAITLDLPLAPVCRDDCAGLCPTCGANRNDVDCGHDDKPADPRWAALSDWFDRDADDR
ncbi:MAG: DUF177 domain-containing protein [Acidimicrobiia bacterium]